MNRSSRFSKAAPIAAFLVLCLFLALGLTKDPKALPSNLINKAVPEFRLSLLQDDQRLVTEEMLEGRITLLNVFGSWCQACLVEHPTLLRLKERNSFDIVGINWRDTRPKADNWLTRFGNPYDLILFDADSSFAISLGVTGAPETFILDRNKRIRYKHVGPITDDVFVSKIAPVIDALLSEPT